MKKLLLTAFSVMSFAGLTMAQDIYGAGYYTDGSLTQQAAVYKNGSKLHQSSFSNGFKGKSSGVVLLEGEVYWTNNCYNSSDVPNYAAVMKNNEIYMSTPNGTPCVFNTLFHSDDLFAAGWMSIDGVKTAALWKNDDATPLYTLGNPNLESEATNGCIDVEGEVYTCGCQSTSTTAYHGVVWKNNQVYFELADGTKISDIALYDGKVYTVGYAKMGNNYSLKVWEGTTELYSLSSSGYETYRASISVNDGDIYVTGYAGGPDKLWKNGVVLYTTQNGYFQSVVAKADGVYYSGSDGLGKIWKDGSVIYSPSNCSRVLDLYIEKQETSVGEGVENGIAVYPNPAQSVIRVTGVESNTEVLIFNALGELIKTSKVDANGEVGIAELADGLYTVRFGNVSLRFVKMQ